MSGWKFVSVIDKSEVLMQSQSLSDIFWGIFLVTFLIIVIFISVISDYITKPILKIASVIERMSQFKFEDSDTLNLYFDCTSISIPKELCSQWISFVKGSQSNVYFKK
jgi:sensor histidine kinase YesM